MSQIDLTGPVLDMALLVAAVIVVLVLCAYLSLKASYRRARVELNKGAIINGLQYLPIESELLLEAASKAWNVIRYYRTAKGGFFVYRAAFGVLGWKGSGFHAITKEEAMEVLGAKDIKKFTEVFGKPKKA